MPLRLRPSVLTAGFVVLFAVIANLAWATAVTTTGPWFDASVSLTVYSLALVLGASLSIVLVHQAAARAAHLDASLMRLDRRIALLRAAQTSETRRSPPPDELDLDAGLAGFPDGGSRALVRLEKQGHDTLVPVPSGVAAGTRGTRTAILRELTRERIAIRESWAKVWSTAAGPILAAVGFLAIAGPMLPGSGGFAAAHYVLNTTLILFLSYGFAPLVAWTVIALAMMGSPGRRSVA